uniref:Ig-like domain-containing protein n=1 Tax=Monopterus albus TaxID=43700 RepID=A0A3Q3IIZ8_MONAL
KPAAVCSLHLDPLSSALCLLFSALDQINKTAEPGENITLPCRAPSSTNITVVEWIRPDLRPEYVFVYRSMQHDPDNQHEFFKDRVELEDSEMKDGNVSLVLRNVTTGDRGTYECRVVQGKTTRRKRYLNNEPISTIYLDVKLGECVSTTIIIIIIIIMLLNRSRNVPKMILAYKPFFPHFEKTYKEKKMKKGTFTIHFPAGLCLVWSLFLFFFFYILDRLPVPHIHS